MFRFDSVVRYSEIDADRYMTLPAILDILQDCCTFHSEHLEMGIDYLKEHEADIDAFMDAYKDSVEFVNSDTEAAAQIIGNHDIIPAEVAAKAIPECSIVFMEGDEMQTILSGYLNTLNEQNPETIGGQLPDEDFYYKR